MEDSSSQCNKCKNRPPTPLPGKLFSFPTYSDTEPDNTNSEMSFNIYSQDKGSLSTDKITPETFYIPMTSYNACQATLPRPSCIPVLKTQNTTKNQHSKDKPTTQKTKSLPRPSRILVFNNKRYKLTPQVTQPEVQPTISSFPRPSEETIIKQPMQIHPEPTPITKSPLLPTPLAHNRQSTSPRSSASTSSRKSHLSKTITIHFKTITNQQLQIPPAFIHPKTSHTQIQQPTTTTTSKTIMPTPELLHKTISTASTGTRTLPHKTISTASTASRTLHTASISTTICSHHNIDTIQPDQQCPSTANKTFPTRTNNNRQAKHQQEDTNEARRHRSIKTFHYKHLLHIRTMYNELINSTKPFKLSYLH